MKVLHIVNKDGTEGRVTMQTVDWTKVFETIKTILTNDRVHHVRVDDQSCIYRSIKGHIRVLYSVDRGCE